MVQNAPGEVDPHLRRPREGVQNSLRAPTKEAEVQGHPPNRQERGLRKHPRIHRPLRKRGLKGRRHPGRNRVGRPQQRDKTHVLRRRPCREASEYVRGGDGAITCGVQCGGIPWGQKCRNTYNTRRALRALLSRKGDNNKQGLQKRNRAL